MGEDLHTLVVGIDEAGRGPVLGDLIIGMVVATKNNIELLRTIGVRDSKELSPGQRSRIYRLIIDNALYVSTYYIPPYIIDRRKLNKLIAEKILKMMKILKEIIYYSDITYLEIYIDEIKGYREYIGKNLNNIFKNYVLRYIMESRADSKYPIVSAASILAKYYRDKNLNSSKQLYGEFGSGYPSDPRTREWIIEYYDTYQEPPVILRRSWDTLLRIAPKWYHDYKKGKSILDYMKR